MDWTPSLSVGVEVIDEQHKELFFRIGKLVDAIKSKTCKEEIEPTIKFLQQYVVKHFSDEERIMRQNNYPDYETHKAEHDQFIFDFTELKTELQGEKSNYAKSAYTNKIVVDWILEHIKKIDTRLGKYLAER